MLSRIYKSAEWIYTYINVISLEGSGDQPHRTALAAASALNNVYVLDMTFSTQRFQ